MRYVVDTCIFNEIADGRLKRGQLPADAELVTTYVQVEEINRTKDEGRRGRLFLAFAMLEPKMHMTASLLWGKTPFGLGAWGVGAEFHELKAALDARNRSKPNNEADALIAETALKNGYGLITADRDLAEVASARMSNVVHIAF
jgi:predicted nucleic acid-binding protein